MLFHRVINFLDFLIGHKSQKVKNRSRIRETLFSVIFHSFFMLGRHSGETLLALLQVLGSPFVKVFGLSVDSFIKFVHLFGLCVDGLEQFDSIDQVVIEFTVLFLDI